jgi:hypothetical protein
MTRGEYMKLELAKKLSNALAYPENEFTLSQMDSHLHIRPFARNARDALKVIDLLLSFGYIERTNDVYSFTGLGQVARKLKIFEGFNDIEDPDKNLRKESCGYRLLKHLSKNNSFITITEANKLVRLKPSTNETAQIRKFIAGLPDDIIEHRGDSFRLRESSLLRIVTTEVKQNIDDLPPEYFSCLFRLDMLKQKYK